MRIRHGPAAVTGELPSTTPLGFGLGRRTEQRRSGSPKTGLALRRAAAPDSGSLMETVTASIYDTIFARRDVRGEFTGEAIDPSVLERLLRAAHAAPSVGLSQPWDFILVEDGAIRQEFWSHVETERRVFSASLAPEQAALFDRIRVEGIREASTSLVVTYDPDRGSPHVLGRHAIADAGLYSVCLAIENLWLAATAEGWGVGWVSFFREAYLRDLLSIPERIRPVAWLCVGPVTHHQAVPDLERLGWRRRAPLDAVLHRDRW